MSSMSGNSDPYLYPGTSVLRNLAGLTDPAALDRFEARRTHRRIAELIETPIQGRFDAAHLKQIHWYIFQDVYDWAGQFRIVNMSKSGTPFGMAAFLDSAIDNLFAKLAAEDFLKGFDASRFADRAAYFLGELNAIHPFRDGNGRTQREFLRELGLNAAYSIDWRAANRREMTDASRASHITGDFSKFAAILRACLTLC